LLILLKKGKAMAHVLSYRIGSLQKPHLPFAQVAEMGIQGLELVWNDQTTVAQVQAALKPSGLRVTSLHAPCPLDDEDLPMLLGQRAENASALGASYLFVSAQAGPLPRQEAYDRLRRAGDAVGKHRIYLALETHPDLCQNGAQMLETMQGVGHPWVGVNYDTANVYFYNQGVDTIAELGKVVHLVRGVHLKDTMGGYKDWGFPVFGEGVVDFAAVEKVLTQGGYTGPCCMELEGGAFDASKPEELAAKVRRCVEHLRQKGVVD
jgi:sugar phosphate isomerase/epimerase